MTARFDPYRMLEILNRHQVRFVVVGAFSAVVQGYPLPTQDLDVTPARDPENLERLAAAMQELGARMRVPEGAAVAFPLDAKLLEQAVAWTLTTVAGPLDLVFEPAGTSGYDDVRNDAVELSLRGLPLVLASLRDVIRMKEAAGREKDLMALPALRRTLELIRRREAEGR
ncbi:MAG: hypothetical protein ACR2GT_08180 [Gaiellaceae bacterium]